MRSRSVVIAVMIGVIAVAAIIVAADRRQSASQGKTLSGATLRGGSFELSSSRGKPVVVNFFASWCPPCNSEAPDLAAFSKAHPEVVFVGVAVNDRRADTEAFLKKYGLDYSVVVDESGAISDAWGVSGIPTTFFVDRKGAVKDSIVGAASRDRFEAALQNAL
jgi:cytochrome c biogenesis protein CcmG, thiol:disulfide interchange protein DsbE